MTEEEIKALQKELEEAKAKATALENSKSRVIEESNNFKKRAQDAEDKITAAEKAKLEESGKLEELLAQEREEKKKLQNDLMLTKTTVISEKLRAEVAKEAKDVHDIDVLLGLKQHKALLKVNDDLSVEGVKDFVAKARETHAFMFGTKKMPDTDDGANGGKKPDQKTVDEEYKAALKACKSRAEMHTVMKKFGKDLHT